MKAWWNDSYRRRCTVLTLFGIMATPFVIVHGSRTFFPYVARGGYITAFAWTGLLSVYYVTLRCWFDLATDVVDWLGDDYSLKGGDITKLIASQLRTNVEPYDLVTASDVKRDWSLWQYLLKGWTFVESVPIGWIVLFAVGKTLTQSPYLDFYKGPSLVNGGGGRHDISVGGVLLGMTYVFTIFGILSIVRRNAAGVMPLPLRWLGLPNYYPGQNVYPQWVNKLAIALIKRPM